MGAWGGAEIRLKRFGELIRVDQSLFLVKGKHPEIEGHLCQLGDVGGQSAD